MADNKTKIIVYRDWISTFESLSDEEAGKLIKHFFQYINDLNPEAPDRLTMLLFEPIKQTLKRDLRAYQETCEKNKDNVSKRWNKKNTTVYDRKKTHTKHTDSDSVIDSDIVISKDIYFNKEKIDISFLPLVKKWAVYRKKIKSPYKTQIGFDAFCKELKELSGGNLIMAEKIVEQSINKEWKGIFELKTDIKIKANGNRHGSVQAGVGGRAGSSTL